MIVITASILCAFVIGFLIGENRAVRQCNSILDANTKVLLEAISEERPQIEDADDAGESRATVH